jgi:hypothetical protein
MVPEARNCSVPEARNCSVPEARNCSVPDVAADRRLHGWQVNAEVEMMRVVALFAATLIAGACNGREPEPAPGQPAPGQPATEMPAATDDPQAVDTDTVSFIQQGRTLEFGGREWILTGEPVLRPIVRHVGTAEGIELYATAAEQGPSQTLFFYLGNGYWQALGPTGSPIHMEGEAGAVQPDG